MVNILVFSPHPDDAVLIIGGIILQHMKKYSIMIVNITSGGLSAFGTAKIRREEEQLIFSKYKIPCINLNFPDGKIGDVKEEIILECMKLIREYKPAIVLAPYLSDEHPDHQKTYEICKTAVYFSGTMESCKDIDETYCCKNIFFYSQKFVKTNAELVYFDVSNVYGEKLDMISMYFSQFDNRWGKTLVNMNLVEQIKAKDLYCGKVINVSYAEQLIVESEICCTNLFDIVRI